ncbi:hypothetical protein NUH86_17785 [Sphingobium sp. JS3065]|uniref:hypothetical protein n=1 Tax=Sphingobium sp. JS3065 TaxID=2970925 RepID=UPI0022646AA8|nr:hypothetical protein [Sphingobium sp. JS3065]UZW57438.1 hypothetical protein NUH86_17785 [Sphingobium sp. JS3065]
MFDVIDRWVRLMESGFSMAQTGMRAMETLGSGNEVIAARMTIIGAAMQSPHRADYAELARMMPEKVDAVSRAGAATVAAWWAAQAAWAGQMQHLGMMAMRGRPPTREEFAHLGNRVATATVEAIEAQARLGARALAPVHRRATSNARRLRRRTKKS